MIFVSIFFVLLFVLFSLSLIKYNSFPAAILTGYLLFVSNIVFVFLAANTFYELANRNLILILQAVLSVIMIGLWFLRGKPPLFQGTKNLLRLLKNRSLIQTIKEWPLIIILGSGVFFTYSFYLILIWIVAPNNTDSLHTHLARLGYWLQNNSFFPWQTLNFKQLFYPVNISLQVFWTILFQGTDRLAGYVQWVSAIITIIAVYGIARLLNAKRPQALFAALLWASFPIILFQSTSTQLDLSSASLFLAAVYFLILGIKTESKKGFIASGLALALALGAKQTIIFLLPGLLIFTLLQWTFWRRHFKLLLTWALSTTLFFLVLSSYIFIVNYATYGNVAGPKDVVSESTGSSLENMFLVMPRLMYQSIDFSGLPKPIEAFGNRTKAKVMETIQKGTGFTLETSKGNAPDQQFAYRDFQEPTEDAAWFGFASLAILLPAVIIVFIKAIKKKETLTIGLILLSVSFLPVNAFLRWGWDPYQGRYFIGAVGLIAPLMFICVNKRNYSKYIQAFAVIIAAATMIGVSLYNPSKPLKSNDVEIFSADRQKLQSLSAGKSLWNFTYMINRSLPENAVVAYYAEGTIYDYALFGEHFTRTVIPLVDPKFLADEEWLKSKDIQYVLVDVSHGLPGIIAEKLIEYDEVKGSWMMYTWSKAK